MWPSRSRCPHSVAFPGPREGPRFRVTVFWQHGFDGRDGEWNWKLVFLPFGRIFFGPGFSTRAEERRHCFKALERLDGGPDAGDPRIESRGRGRA